MMANRLTYCEKESATKELTVKQRNQASKEIKYIKNTEFCVKLI